MKRCIVAVILLVVILTGCGSMGSLNKDGDIMMYAFRSDHSGLLTYGYDFDGILLKDRINEVFSMMTVSSDSYLGILNDKMNVISWVMGEENTLQITFGEHYYEIEPSIEVLSRGAIVKTFCQLPEIDGVEFYVSLDDNTENIRDVLMINNAAVGIMNEEMFLEELGMAKDTTALTLYYATEDGNLLKPIEVTVESNDNYTLEQQIVLSLVVGNLPEGVVRPVSNNTKINRIVTRDSVCYIDFSSDFLVNVENVNPSVTVYSIVNSLVQLPGVSKVVLTVNGESISAFGDVDMTQIFERSHELVEGEE